MSILPIIKKTPSAIKYIMHLDQYNGGWKVTVADTLGTLVYAGTAGTLGTLVFEAAKAAYAISPTGAAAIFTSGSIMVTDIAGVTSEMFRDTVLTGLYSDEFIEFENYLTTHPTIGPLLQDFQVAYNNWLFDSNAKFPALTDYLLDNISAAHEMYKYYKLEIQELLKNPENIIPTFAAYIESIVKDVSDYISDAISTAYWNFLDAVARSLLVDPLVIDMAGDGLSLDSWQKSNALFDLDANGTKENTGWTKANDDDSFLVIDKNNNGSVDNIMEMFGNAAMAGFVDLKSYDSNNDNLINASDSQFNLMKLWNDKNANGVVDTGELTTLAANGITQISLNKYSDREMIEGNLQTAISEVTFANGTVRNIHELSFAFEGNTITTTGDRTLTGFHIKLEALLLPYWWGYSSMYSLQMAVNDNIVDEKIKFIDNY